MSTPGLGLAGIVNFHSAKTLLLFPLQTSFDKARIVRLESAPTLGLGWCKNRLNTEVMVGR